MINRLTFKETLCLIPAFLAIHNFEEILTIVDFSKEALKGMKITLIQPYNFWQMSASIILITITVTVLTLIFFRSEKRSPGIVLLLSVQALLFVNALTHILSAIYFFKYAPALFTSIFLYVPFTIYLFKRALDEGYIIKKEAVIAFIAGIILYLPSVLIFLKMGNAITSFLGL
jgi:hypothetical protein